MLTMNGKAVGDRIRMSYLGGDTVDIVRNKGCGGNGTLFLPRLIIADQLREVCKVPDA